MAVEERESVCEIESETDQTQQEGIGGFVREGGGGASDGNTAPTQ